MISKLDLMKLFSQYEGEISMSDFIAAFSFSCQRGPKKGSTARRTPRKAAQTVGFVMTPARTVVQPTFSVSRQRLLAPLRIAHRHAGCQD